MQKQKNKQKYQRSHPVRLGSLVVAASIVFSLTGLGHEKLASQHIALTQLPRALADNLERENETDRHAVRLDVGLRQASISGY